MSHDHDHNHGNNFKELFERKGFVISLGILLNLIFVIMEFIYGMYFDSMAILSDAGHNLGDVSGLFLALMGYLLSKKKPSGKFNFGWKKASILVSLFNSIFILILIGFIFIESIERLQNPQKVESIGIMIFAALGIFINSFSAYLFLDHKDNDLNIKTAYLHLVMDVAVSTAVLFSGIAIYFTGLFIIDPIISILVLFILLPSAIRVFKESLSLSMDGVPKNLSLEEIQKELKNLSGVVDCKELKIRAISTEENSLTCILEFEKGIPIEKIQKTISEAKHLLEHKEISESIIEFRI
ncbi:MAG: cation transporter [Leptospiraceae bacterium]|nr:cation transporter [Leptospiraceae bacterium]